MIERCSREYCPHEFQRDGWCIFHLPDKNKEESSDFERSIARMIETGTSDQAVTDLDFRGFVFPADFRFSPVEEYPEGPYFPKSANFQGASFLGEAQFAGAVFKGHTKFSDVNFSKGAKFSWARFCGSTDFDRAEFLGPAIFSRAVFKDAWFIGVTFNDLAVFIETEFLKSCNFGYAEFRDQVEFKETVFPSALFYKTRFRDQAYFKAPVETKLAKTTAEIAKSSVLILYFASFDRPNLVALVGWPLSRLSALMSDVSNVLIIPKRENYRKIGILDESLLEIRETRRHASRIDKKAAREALFVYGSLGPVYLNRETLAAEYERIRRSLERNLPIPEVSELLVREKRLLRRPSRTTGRH